MEGIRQDAVVAWLQERVEGFRPPVEFSLIAGGHSNLTYRCADQTGTAVVLRRPPLGHVLESAHDMGREYKIIHALQGTDVPVAPTIGLCADVDVNDAPFYVMQFIEGPVLHDAETARGVPEAERHTLGLHVIDILASLHAIEPNDVGLGDLGRREAYLTRQLKRWNKQWQASKTHDVPEMEESSKILSETMPEQIGSAIVHGDYRLGNMIVGDGQIQAVLDWELCTLGDPLADVGYLMNSWVEPGDAMPELTPTSIGGFPSRALLCDRYTEATGRNLDGINYYRAFAHWRLAAIGQGVYKRYLVGAMGENRDLDLDTYKNSIQVRAAAALSLLTHA